MQAFPAGAGPRWKQPGCGVGMGAGSDRRLLGGPHLMAPYTSPAFQLLEENDQLIRCIVEYQNKGRANECVQ